MKKRLANLISVILNPFLVSLAVIILLSFESTSSAADALKWSLILIVLSVLPVFVVIFYLVRRRKLEGVFISTRGKRHRIYLVAVFFGIVGSVVLYILEAPLMLVAIFVAGLVAMIIFFSINLFWKVSIHSAFVAALVTILIILYSPVGALAAALLPPIAWARVELEYHSAAQAVTGAILAAIIMLVVFYLFGLIGGFTRV